LNFQLNFTTATAVGLEQLVSDGSACQMVKHVRWLSMSDGSACQMVQRVRWFSQRVRWFSVSDGSACQMVQHVSKKYHYSANLTADSGIFFFFLYFIYFFFLQQAIIKSHDGIGGTVIQLVPRATSYRLLQ